MANHKLHNSTLAINIDPITKGAICQLLQKDLIIVEHFDFGFGLITLRRMDFIRDDGMFKRFNFDTGLVP